jgi:gliding-associated putative ABC transporter substrate-binding component GldG
MAKKNISSRDDLIILLTTVGSVALLNVLSLDHFARLDLTADRAYTLAEASRQTMRDLEDPVTVTAYFSSGLPTQFEQNRRYVKDLLEEYRASSKGLLSFEFIDPQALETDEDKETKKELKRDIFGRAVREQTSVETELEGLGVSPVEMRVLEDDQATTKRGYMGIVVRYQESTEVIPVVQETTGLEYDLTTLIRRLTRTRVPVLGVLQGKGSPSLDEELARVKMLYEQTYAVRGVTLEAENPTIDDEVDALLIVGNKEAYNEGELRAVDAFLMKGNAAAFLVDVVDVDLQTFQPTPVENGFSDFLSHYGIGIGDRIVGDVECASLNVQEKRGFMLVSMPVKYPFIPQLRFLDAESPITRGLTDVPIPFPAPLFLKTDIPDVAVKSLARSSEKSWLDEPEMKAMDPRRKWGDAEIIVTGPYDLIASAEGLLPSAFADGATDGAKKAEKPARIIVAGTSGLAEEAFLSQTTATLLMNIVDWMLMDPAILDMRNRGISVAPLEPELSDTVRQAAKFGNAVGIPLLLFAFGALLWRKRSARRAALKP